MIAYITLGTNNREKAYEFYDALFGELGAKPAGFSNERVKGYTTGQGTELFIGTPFNDETATSGNGTMVAIPVGSRENVDRLHAKALELGASDEGAPGERMEGFYAAYFRDLDGNKFLFFHGG